MLSHPEGSPQRQIPLSVPYTGEEEWLALREPLATGWLTQGPQVAAFESEFARRHQVPHAVATSNCTTALHLILAALDIGPGDEVIVPAFTWVASANAVVYCGATPVLVDVDAATYNVDVAAVEQAITSRTRAIVAVHLFGLCAELQALAAVAGDIPIIEDAACAAGASYHGRPAGSMGLAGAFSFHPRKSITTGEGGMVTTHDPDLAARVSALRNHGASMPAAAAGRPPRPWEMPDFDLLGYNYRMTDLQAALGRVQLGRLDEFIAERQAWAEFYARELGPLEWLRVPATPEGLRHAWQAYVLLVDEATAPASRNDVMDALLSRGIHTRPGTHAVHALGYYAERFGLRAADCPVALRCYEQTIAIPMHNRMTADDYGYVVEALHSLDAG